jgi:hypothetical protein
MRRLQRMQLALFLVIIVFLLVQLRQVRRPPLLSSRKSHVSIPQSATVAWYGPGIVKWLGESASNTVVVQKGGREGDLGTNGRDLKRQKGGSPERSYIMFDRASDLGPPTRITELDLKLDDNYCRNTVQGPDIITDDRGDGPVSGVRVLLVCHAMVCHCEQGACV